MVQLINLGGASQVNGKTVLNGSNSGLDDTSLINELAAAKAQPATNLQTKITANTAKIAAYSQAQSLMTTLQTSLDALRNPPGIDANANVFSARTPYVTMSDGSTSSNYIGIATNNGAPIGNYTISVDQLAASETQQSVSFADSTSSAVGGSSPLQAGSFTLNGQVITLTAGESLTNIASSINSVSSQSNVTASLVKLSGTDTRLVLTDKKTGAANTINITNDTTGISGSQNGTPTLATTQAAQDAQIQFNGNTVTRSTNTINDLLTGVTFTLYQPTPVDNTTSPATKTTATLSIDKDDTTIATAIGNFVDAYNAVRTFQANQNAHDPSTGALLPTAILGSDQTLSTIVNQLSSAINSQTSDELPPGYTTDNPTRLSDIGILLTSSKAVPSTTNADGSTTAAIPAYNNMLTVNTSTLASALDTNFDAVANIFQFGFTSSSSDLSNYSRDNTVATSDFTIQVGSIGASQSTPPYTNNSTAQITAIDGQILATPIQLTGYNANGIVQFNVQGQVNTDSPLADANFSFNYSGSGNETVDKSETLSSKAYGISADATAGTASLTSIYGAALATPEALTYTTSGGSALIQGAAGSSLAGLKMVYTGTGAENINISLSQGLADSVYNSLDSMINGTNNNGLLTSASSNLTTTDTQLQSQITAINSQVDAYRTQLQTKFANLESAIGSANSLLQLLSAQSNAQLEGTSGS